MAERRKLIAGLRPAEEVDPAVAKQFIYGDKDAPEKSEKPSAAPAVDGRDGKPQSTISRVPLTTRIRGDFAAALKRASLERQLSGEVPNTMLDILEEALEPWLRQHGYIQ